MIGEALRYQSNASMSSKRVWALTFNYLTALSRVRSARRFPRSVTHFNKFLSTAPERWDFRSPSRTSQFENSPYDTPTSLVYEQKQNGQALNPNQGFEVCPTDDNTRSSGWDNRNSYYGGLQPTGNQMGSVGQTGNFGWYHHSNEATNGNLGTNPNGIYENGSWKGAEQGCHQNHDGMHWENNRYELQNNSVYRKGNFRGCETNAQNTSNMQNQVGSYWEGPPEIRQNQLDLNLQRFPESQGSQMDLQCTNFSQYRENPQNIYNFNSYGQVTSNFNFYGQASATSNPNEGLTEVSESSTNNATVEKLEEFCNKGNVKEAVEVLVLMKQQGIPVDLAQILQLMKACGEVKALQEAKTFHEHLIGSFSPLKISIYNRILEMYLKCGSTDDAFDVFEKMPRRNLTSWDTMITGLARNGLGEDALDLFSQFKQAGLKPDAKMFLGVFYSCGVVGDINEGMLHFLSMSSDYGIIPSMEHYVGVVDMLGSTGHLDEALEFIENMPSEASVDVWETLMNLCRIHGHLELGDLCAELVNQLDASRLNDQSKAGLIPLKDSDLKKNEKKKLASQSPLENIRVPGNQIWNQPNLLFWPVSPQRGKAAIG
ncbi:Pentatricopeptide repeat-containing, mitochondrial -like protein [Gossypium arboreum]|uniref:Pentatricopeptide repeat-containing, mitochondrial-like protein n=1 Tax=Gossypium arboreum TaxID=29729 RepID=A0A0B0PBM6_GOSAR|nr:Pentatricopeptide repeat-containing, mitochondrial -like protein [Gossypium arboreum]